MTALMIPQFGAYCGDLAEVEFAQGKRLYEQKDYTHALAAFDRAARDEPADERFLYWAGKSAGRLAEAAGPLAAFSLARRTRLAFERAYELNPRNLEVMEALAQFYTQAPGFMGGSEAKAQVLNERIRVLKLSTH